MVRCDAPNAGYGWEALAQAEWLKHCAPHYWGDIDTHGFAILDQRRSRLAQARTFLMDRETLPAHEAHCGKEPEPARPVLDRVNLVSIDDGILRFAAAIEAHIKSLDAIHLATCGLLVSGITVVTHDENMAEVAASLGLEAIDPLSG